MNTMYRHWASLLGAQLQLQDEHFFLKLVIATGMAEYLQKPYAPEVLLRKISELLAV